MDRRYYGLKIAIIVIALAVAMAGSSFEPSRWSRISARDAHYQAATLMQAAIRDTETRLTRILAKALTPAS